MARRKKNRSHSGGGGSLPNWQKSMIMGVTAAAHGAFRDQLAEKIPAIPKIENYSDEVILGGAGAILAFVPMGKASKYTRPVGQVLMSLEIAKAAAKVAAKTPLGTS